MTRLEPVPDGIRRFVLGHLASVAELEGLLLVRSAPDRAWTVRDVADRLYVAGPQAHVVLEALVGHALMVHRERAYMYRPASEALRHDVEVLAAAYPRLLIPITALIHARVSGADSAT